MDDKTLYNSSTFQQQNKIRHGIHPPALFLFLKNKNKNKKQVFGSFHLGKKTKKQTWNGTTQANFSNYFFKFLWGFFFLSACAIKEKCQCSCDEKSKKITNILIKLPKSLRNHFNSSAQIISKKISSFSFIFLN